MGLINKIYSQTTVTPSSKMYSNHFTIERTENFHIHLRNLRIELDKNEYRMLSVGFIFAFFKWIFTGMKEKTPGENQFLFKDKVPNSPSITNGFTTSDEVRVELQQWADFVHIHYKNIRLEFTVDEAKEFVQTISESLPGIIETSNTPSRVQRVGFNHRAVPSLGCTTGDKAQSEFWTDWSETKDLENPFLTTLIGEDKHDAVNSAQRKTGEEGIFSFYIDDLFETSLHLETYKNSFGFYDGVFLPLFNRYNFARLVLERDFDLTEKEIRDTQYFQLLEKGFDAKPRDGSLHTVYKDPLSQAKRFILLIETLKEQKINDLESIENYHASVGSSVQVFENMTEHLHEGVNNDSIKMITCLAIDTSIVINDGLHRIATLKALKDLGLISDQTVDCFLINPKKIYGNSVVGLMRSILRNLEPRKLFGLGLKSKLLKGFRKRPVS